jgi:stringent starvation protein B
VHGFHIGNDMIRFSARFGGKPFAIELAPQAVLGLFARENGQGMLFPDEEPAAPEAEADADADADATAGTDNTSDDGDKKPSRPNLRIVK